MARPTPDPSDVKAALAMLASGFSTRDVSRVAGVSAVTVSRWAKKYGPKPRPVLVAPPPKPEPEVEAEPEVICPKLEIEPPPPESTEPDDPPIDLDTLTSLRRMHQDMLRTSRGANRVGNYATAQRSMRDAAALANTIARVERDTRAAGDSLVVSKDELDAARARVRETAQAILERPMLCAHCSRALSASWGESDADASGASAHGK